MSLLTWIFSSLITGVMARSLLPGEIREGLLLTTASGCSGIVIAAEAAPIFGFDPPFSFDPAGLLGAILCAVFVLLLCRLLLD